MTRFKASHINISYRYFFYIVTGIVFTIFMTIVYCCNQKNNNNDEVKITSPDEQNEQQNPLKEIKRITNEIKSENKFASGSAVSPKIVIPGRTMRSAVFAPGICDSVSIAGARLTVPVEAVSYAKCLSLTGLLTDDLPPVPAEITNVTKSYPGYRFLPHGTLFSSAVSIALAYDESMIPEGYSSDDIYTYYFDESDSRWKALKRDSVDHNAGMIISNTLHFTDMINGIIIVPESPETGGYVPTTIKEFKTADPATGITFIEPPKAVPEGTGELSFAFKLPAGRANMEPKLELHYSTNGNSCWTGYGWSLFIPNITIDVTWGVPRYDAIKESETYLLEGDQLTPVAHRNTYVDRSAEKRFYHRVEGAFYKIIRHGNRPDNYWWEVTAKNGEKSFYGGLPETGLHPGSVCRDSKGNIGYWALTQTRDVHGNFVNYSYEKPEGYGEELYISEITYTGYGQEQGPYKIMFLRNDDANNYLRKDARISARLGFIQRDSDLLRRINITFNQETIRSYTLQYKDGAFFKTLLESITELDATGKQFYTHQFDYYDDVQSGKGYVPFKDEKSLSLDDDNIRNPFLNPLNVFFDKVSALGGSGSSGGGGKITITAGPVTGALKDVSVGGGVGYSASTGEELLSLVDIDGDGMTDKVYKKGDKIYYRSNLQTQKIYGDEHEIRGINGIGLSKTSSITAGPEANPPFSYVSYEHSWNKTKTEIYFNDFNGDGLIDLARKGVVYFNHIDTITNEPVFEATSVRTPNPLYGATTVDPSLIPDAAAEQAELEQKFPLHDAVRMWMAPYGGNVIITAPVQLIRDTGKAATADTMKDGVMVSIQHEANVLWIHTIDTTHYELINHPDLGTITVNKGDRIFFRVQSRFNGSYDKVKWDPEINYLTITDPNINTKVKHDVNGRSLTRFKASEDFIIKGDQYVILSKVGRISLLSDFSKPFTSDSLKVEVIKYDSAGSKSVLYTRDFSCDEVVSNLNINLDTSVIKHDKLSFRVTSPSNIDWSSIKWKIYMKYISFADTTPVTNYEGKPMFEFWPVAEFAKMYNDPFRYTAPIAVDTGFYLSLGIDSAAINSSYTVKIRPAFQYSGSPLGVNDTLVLSVKTRSKLLGRRIYLIQDNAIVGNDTIYADIRYGDSIFTEYHCVNRDYITSLNLASVSFSYDTTSTRAASVSYVKNPDYEIYGHLYRGWGQFDYDGNGERANQGIILNELKLNDQSLSNDATDVKDTTDLKGQHNMVGDVFNVTIPYVKVQGYMGVDEMVFITDSTMSSSRMGMKDVYIAPYHFSSAESSGLPAFNKVTVENSNSFSGGLSAGEASIIASYSSTEVYIQTDMADMNGDNYPDLLSENSIQYTGVHGLLEGSAVDHNLGSHKSSAKAFGVSAGGSNVTAKCVNAMISKTVKNDKKGTQKAQENDQKSRGAEETAETSVGLSGSFSSNEDKNTETWMDINGDGLPDKIYSDGTVRLNLGYSFASPENWNFSAIREGKSEDFGLGGSLGFSYKNRSIEGGIGLSKTTNESTKAFIDINADGLPDAVNGNQVRFNNGSGFSDPITWNGLGSIDAGEAMGENASFAFTISIPIILVRLNINPSGGVSRGVSRNITQFSDMDGDGFPDALYSEKEGELKIKSSTINRTNMLKSVYRPLGSNFTVDYIQTPATYKHPGGAWALASVKMFDGLSGDGVDSSFTTFEYENGFYNRHEREFYGFSKVQSHYHTTGEDDKIYRTLEQQFNNNDYYTRGKIISETLLDGAGNKQTGSEYTYILQDIHSGGSLPETFAQNDSAPAYAALTETKNYLYEGASSPQITTRVTYEYDKMGNISKYTDYSTGKPEDKVDVAIEYHSNDSSYIHAVPSKQEVSAGDELMRRRETNINNLGDITRIKQYISDGVTANYDMEYDQYGNLTKITRPVNYKGERLWYVYTYDSVLHSLVTKVSDAYGYSSTSDYDFKWGLPTGNSDMNNQRMIYTYDDCGRQSTITGPYEIRAGKDFTFKFKYHPEATVPYAQTFHFDSAYNATIETYAFADGTGRQVQVKKSALLFTNSVTDDTPGFIVSGKNVYDAFGRVTHTYHPVFEDTTHADTYNPVPDNMNPKVTSYNVLDSAVQITLPDGSVTTYDYSIGSYDGENMMVDTITDALKHKTVTVTNAKKWKIATIFKSSEKEIVLQFKYNAIGELITITDPKGNKTISEYDKLGRRIAVRQPDAGLTRFFYDPAGNVSKKITANISKQMPDTGAIKYKYDHERLVEIVYPRSVQNRVNYTYGAPGAKHNRAGRIELVQDASGGQEYFYGPLGEVIKTIRTVQVGGSDMRTWIWSAGFDTWNRIRSMVYPDGEKVSYSYNRAGNLMQIKGEKIGQTYDYVSRIGYDKFEKQLFLQYGNGSVTEYSYEPDRQRLSELQVTSNKEALMVNAYTYDALSNILSIVNPATTAGKIGGSTSQAFSYDDLNRLIQASGKYTGMKDTGRYTLTVKYDVMGNMMHKTQEHVLNGKKQTVTTFDFGYTYNGIKPDAASEIGDKIFTYDENGNQTGWEDTVSKDFRLLCWDEENRISLISDNGYINRYVYDANGERVIKSHGGSQGVYINGAAVGIMNHSRNNYTVYVNPYFVLQNERFTKYYYMGNKRVAGKVGTGSFANQYRLGVFEITAGKVNYMNRQNTFNRGVENYIDSLHVPPGPPTMKGVYADPLYTGKPYPDAGTPDTTTPNGWPRKPAFAPAGGPPGAPIQWSNDVTNDNVEAGFGFHGTGSNREVLLYYYHSDHLSSAGYITDTKGNVSQYIAYMPFGETFAEQHGDWDSPYKFNAMEKDNETGLYYFGARYYDPVISVWISADPLTEKDLRFSPYQFANNNPLSFTDPDGRTGKGVIEDAGAEDQNNKGGATHHAQPVPTPAVNVSGASIRMGGRVEVNQDRSGASNAPDVNIAVPRQVVPQGASAVAARAEQPGVPNSGYRQTPAPEGMERIIRGAAAPSAAAAPTQVQMGVPVSRTAEPTGAPELIRAPAAPRVTAALPGQMRAPTEASMGQRRDPGSLAPSPVPDSPRNRFGL
jgi:RHS repeat-associated protein